MSLTWSWVEIRDHNASASKYCDTKEIIKDPEAWQENSTMKRSSVQYIFLPEEREHSVEGTDCNWSMFKIHCAQFISPLVHPKEALRFASQVAGNHRMVVVCVMVHFLQHNPSVLDCLLAGQAWAWRKIAHHTADILINTHTGHTHTHLTTIPSEKENKSGKHNCWAGLNFGRSFVISEMTLV